MNDRLVKIGEAAKILGVNPQTLRRWAEKIENIVSEEKPQLELEFGTPKPTDRTESE